MPAEEADVGDILAAVGDGVLLLIAADGEEGHDLVVRAFGVELHLRVLVGDAERLDGRLADVAGRAGKRHVLAERLRPELRVPVGDGAQVIGVRHEDADVLAVVHRNVLERCAEERGVLLEVGRLAQLVHVGSALQEQLDVDAEHRRGQKSHGGKFGESSAHAVGEHIALDAAELFGDLHEVALCGIRRKDDVILDVLARLLEEVGDDEVLGHRLARRARLGDDVEARLFDVDDIEELLHADGIDVVLDIEFRALALGLGQVVVVQVAERVERHDGAERRTADAEHHEVFKVPADLLCLFQDIRHDLVLIVGELRPAHEQLVAAPVFCHIGVSRLCDLFVRIQRLLRDALVAEVLVRHVGVVHSHAERLAQFVRQSHNKSSIFSAGCRPFCRYVYQRIYCKLLLRSCQ